MVGVPVAVALGAGFVPVSYTHLDVYKRQLLDDLADLTNSFYFIEGGTLVEKIESSSQTLKQEYLDTYEGGE